MKIHSSLLVFALAFSIGNCTHYFLKDPKSVLLNEEQKYQLHQKKFLLLGFHPFHFSLEKRENFESKEPNFPCSYFKSLVKINRDLAVYNCIIEYINAGKENQHPELYNQIYKRIPAGRYNPSYSIPAFINGANTTVRFFPWNQTDTSNAPANSRVQPPEENIKNFLFLYLSSVRHAGLKEIESMIDIEYSYAKDECDCKDNPTTIQKIRKIQFKKSNVDFYILANQRKIYSNTFSGNISNKISKLKVLTFIPSILTLGVVPYWDEALFESKFYIFDKDLNQIQTLVYQDRIDHISAIWLIFSNFEDSLLIHEGIRYPRDNDKYEIATRRLAHDIYIYLTNPASR